MGGEVTVNYSFLSFSEEEKDCDRQC